MNKIKFIAIVLFILLLCIITISIGIFVNHKRKLFKENFITTTKVNSYTKFVNDLGHYKSKKKYVLIFTGGPTLTEFKKSDFSPEIYNDCYIIAVKNTINYLDSLNIKPDFLVSNFIGSASSLDVALIQKHNPITIGIDFGNLNHLRPYFKYLIKIIDHDPNQNAMKCVMENKKKCFDFYNLNDEIKAHWGHTMGEVAIPLALFLEPKQIITIGWDVTNSNTYWNTNTNTNILEPFTNNNMNWHNSDVIINNFTVYLHDYLQTHYHIPINKLNPNSGVQIPLYNY